MIKSLLQNRLLKNAGGFFYAKECEKIKKYFIIYAVEIFVQTDGATEHHYPTMSIGGLCALPVETLAEKDCLSFLWVTFPQLPEALRLINAWGFSFKP